MTSSPELASPGTPGGLATPSDLVDLGALLAAYEDRRPDPGTPSQRVAFGTSADEHPTTWSTESSVDE